MRSGAMTFNEEKGEGMKFSDFHPIVNAVYFAVVIGVTIFSMSPYFLLLSLSGAFIYSLVLKGKKAIKQNISIVFITLVIMTGINALFTHNGETVLFYIRHNRITMEAVFFGIASSVMLSSVIILFDCFHVIMSEEKLIYLFGRIAPVFGLMVSMIFRFVPLLRCRFKEIQMGQACMGRNAQTGVIRKIRQLLKELSILIAWSLEASIESADSMAARGYGLPGRSSFHLFKITVQDVILLIIVGVCGGITVAGCIFGRTTMQYYPKLLVPAMAWKDIICISSFGILVFMPSVIEYIGGHKWER